jgi:hypothetical protein
MSFGFRAFRILLIITAIEFVLGCAFQSKLIFPAERIPAGAAFSANKGGEEVSIKTEDGILLSGPT